MKKSILFLFSFLLSLSLFAKPNPIDSLKKRTESLELTENSYAKINDSLISINNNLISENSNLTKEVDYNQKLLDRYDILNNTIFTIIGILLGVFGLAIPLLGYFFVYKPSKEELKEAKKLLNDIENDMEEVFSKYLIKNRDNFIDNVLARLENNHEKIRVVEEVNRLETYSAEGFNDKQILRIINLARNDEKHRAELFYLIQQKENIFTTEFLKNELKKKSYASLWALMYAADFNKEDFIDDIVDYILKVDLYASYNLMHKHNPAFVAKLFDNDNLVNKMSDEMLKDFGHKTIFRILPAYRDTKLAKKNSELIQNAMGE